MGEEEEEEDVEEGGWGDMEEEEKEQEEEGGKEEGGPLLLYTWTDDRWKPDATIKRVCLQVLEVDHGGDGAVDQEKMEGRSSKCPFHGGPTSISVEWSSSKYAGKSASADKSSIARKEASDWTRSPARSMSSVLRVI